MSLLRKHKTEPEADELKKAKEILENGGVIAIPTETVYGLAGGIFSADSRKRIYKLKGRSYRKPLIVMAAGLGQLECFVEISDKIKKIAKKFWPGPLTLVLPTTVLGKMVSGGRVNLGVRIPDHKAVLKLIEVCGFPLMTTSANPSSRPSARTAKEVQKYFGAKDVGLVIDAGRCELGKESTVIDLTHIHGVVIREGALDSKKLLPYI
jgi:L-threonylcarbamoyladenylate synthase